MRQMEHWLTFWKKLEGRDGKNELRQGTEEKRTEKGDGKWNDLSLWIEELELYLQEIKEIPQSSRDKIALSESEGGHWSPGDGGSSHWRTRACEI